MLRTMVMGASPPEDFSDMNGSRTDCLCRVSMMELSDFSLRWKSRDSKLV